MVETVLPQLQSIEADLAEQESQIRAQLADIQEKLSGIRTVLPLFGDTDPDALSSLSGPDDNGAEAQSKIATPARASRQKTKTGRQMKTRKTTKAATRATAPKSTRKKKDGRTANWQKYARPGVTEKSIPEAVRLVLETQPRKSFKISEVMEALFEDDMPRSQYLKARNRISNILSGGVRSGEWHRGERSTYRLSA